MRLLAPAGDARSAGGFDLEVHRRRFRRLGGGGPVGGTADDEIAAVEAGLCRAATAGCGCGGAGEPAEVVKPHGDRGHRMLTLVEDRRRSGLVVSERDRPVPLLLIAPDQI